MAKKFSNLSRGKDKFANSLASFVTDPKEKKAPSFNPLTDDKRKLRKKQEDKPEEKKEAILIDVKEEPSKKEVKKQEAKARQPQTKPKVKETPIAAYPDDFKGHSALYSSAQLDELRNVVNYKKWKENPKYSIQQAIYEGIELLLNERKPIKDFPDDFITATQGLSQFQMEQLQSFIGEIKYKENPKYALKYALYEAIGMYLKSNKING